jgi:ribosomal protein S18 acetylase RimI-like enzyme
MLTIRAAETDDAPAIARVHVETWQAAYRGIIPQSYLDSLTVQNRTMSWIRILERGGPEVLTLVSEDHDGRVVGFASGGPIRHVEPGFAAEITALYVSPRTQRNGHGRRLFMALANRLARLKLNGLFVWVLAENPARRFYEALSGQQVNETTRDFAGKPLREIGYGWPETPNYD